LRVAGRSRNCLTGLIRSLDAAELRRSFGVVIEALIAEIERADADLADRLAAPLRELTG
jgi:hypothetical protein